MKTVSTLLLTLLFALSSTTAAAQSWTPGAKPHQNSKYYNGYGMDYSRGKSGLSHGRGYRPADHDYSHRPSHFSCNDFCPVSLQVGLVSKRFATFFGPGDRYRENLWGQEGCFMNGMQMGLSVQPTGFSGVGFRTGFFYEVYLANGYGVRDLGYNRFAEHDFYFPLDFAYSANVGRDVNLNFYTGLGFNVALAGIYRSWGRNGGVDYQDYGNYNRPDRINAMWEFGADVRYDHFKLGMSYGLGLNDHEFYDNARTRQNKFTLSAAVVF